MCDETSVDVSCLEERNREKKGMIKIVAIFVLLACLVYLARLLHRDEIIVLFLSSLVSIF